MLYQKGIVKRHHDGNKLGEKDETKAVSQYDSKAVYVSPAEHGGFH